MNKSHAFLNESPPPFFTRFVLVGSISFIHVAALGDTATTTDLQTEERYPETNDPPPCYKMDQVIHGVTWVSRSHGQRKIWDNGGRGVSMRTRADSTTFTPNRSGKGSGLTKTTQAFGAQGMSVTASDEMLPNLRGSQEAGVGAWLGRGGKV